MINNSGEDNNYSLRKFSSSSTIHGSFPSYFYPTAFTKQPNFPLSPRQAEALVRQDPRGGREHTVPIVITPGPTPDGTPRTSIVPRFHSEMRNKPVEVTQAEERAYSAPMPPPRREEPRYEQAYQIPIHIEKPKESQEHRVPDNYRELVVAPRSPYSISENNQHRPVEHVSSQNHIPVNYREMVAAPLSPYSSRRAVPSEHQTHPTVNHISANYSNFVAAPVSPRNYGNYPELTNRDGNSAAGPQEEIYRKLTPLIGRPHYYYEEDAEDVANATMETKVTGQGTTKRVGRWSLAQLRQTDGIIPSQAGWNKGDSQKLMTNFGTPRNTNTRVKAENLQEIPEEIQQRSHGEVRLQSGTNKFSSQRGMTGFGTGRDVCREGKHVNTNPADLAELPEEKIRLSDGIVRLQSGTNKYDSQKGMTGFGTARRETTKMLDSKHPEYDHEKPDQSQIPLQSGTNKFASQKGMTGFGTARRETTKMVDSNHPDYDHEASIDQTTIPLQMGSNKFASQKGMTGFGQPRWEVLDPSISWQNRKSQGMVRLQSGTNRFASQQGMIGFGTIRNTTFEAEGGELPYEAMKVSETIIPSQAGWNKGDSQKNYTSFGAPRDVKGKHLKRIWELEYPEEAEVSLDRL